MTEKIFYTWDDFDQDIKTIHTKLVNDNWIPDYIVGVKRGGLIPAIALSHRFNKPLIMMSCQLRDSKDNQVRLHEVEEISHNKNILIVDDICDSGTTMSKIMVELLSRRLSNIKNCALFYNISQDFTLDYAARIIDRNLNKGWIIFPWEQV